MPEPYIDINPNEPKKAWALPKSISIILILLVPVFLLAAIFSPVFLVKKNTVKSFEKRYPLTVDFNREDLARIIQQMKSDNEFTFYFAVLSEKNIVTAIDEAYRILEAHRAKSEQLGILSKYQTEVKSIAILFNNLDYPDEFFQDPLNFTANTDALWLFIYEEFKLALMGVCYKSLYDKNFMFHWDDTSKEAVTKFQRVITRLTSEQRDKIADSFIPHSI